MTSGHFASLPDRAVLAIAGDDAAGFLQGLITNDIEIVSATRSIYAALLTPQGKILFDFFVCAHEGGFLLDCSASQRAELQKRLTFYRLRAKVTIEDASEAYEVGVAWGDDANFGLGAEPGAAMTLSGAIAYVDPRTAAAGVRAIAPAGSLAALAGSFGLEASDAGAYARHRIALGLADTDADIGSGELFPHETNLDQLNGVDFKKGCYVGQEVVSRMEHRATARKRIVPVHVAGTLPEAGTDLVAGEKSIGTLLSGADGEGLALVRLDRAGSASGAGTSLEADGQAVTLKRPAWAKFEVPGTEAAS